MLGGLAHKWNWRKKREAEGKDTSKPNMVTGGNVQIVWKKFTCATSTSNRASCR